MVNFTRIEVKNGSIGKLLTTISSLLRFVKAYDETSYLKLKRAITRIIYESQRMQTCIYHSNIDKSSLCPMYSIVMSMHSGQSDPRVNIDTNWVIGYSMRPRGILRQNNPSTYTLICSNGWIESIWYIFIILQIRVIKSSDISTVINLCWVVYYYHYWRVASYTAECWYPRLVCPAKYEHARFCCALLYVYIISRQRVVACFISILQGWIVEPNDKADNHGPVLST